MRQHLRFFGRGQPARARPPPRRLVDKMRAKGLQITTRAWRRILKAAELRDAVAAELFSHTTECFSASGAMPGDRPARGLSDSAKSAYPGRLARRAPMELSKPRNTKPANEGGPVSRQSRGISRSQQP